MSKTIGYWKPSAKVASGSQAFGDKEYQGTSPTKNGIGNSSIVKLSPNAIACKNDASNGGLSIFTMKGRGGSSDSEEDDDHW